jgi:hypothetical protein
MAMVETKERSQQANNANMWQRVPELSDPVLLTRE